MTSPRADNCITDIFLFVVTTNYDNYQPIKQRHFGVSVKGLPPLFILPNVRMWKYTLLRSPLLIWTNKCTQLLDLTSFESHIDDNQMFLSIHGSFIFSYSDQVENLISFRCELIRKQWIFLLSNQLLEVSRHGT